MSFPAARISSLTIHGGAVTSGTPKVLVGGMPASRIRDMHTCPMFTLAVPHVGGLVSWGALNVLTGGMQQARLTDVCICAGPPNMVAFGEMFVLVGTEGAFAGADGIALLNNLLAQAAAAARGEGPPYPYAHQDKDGAIVTEYSKNITIKGDSEYQAKVVNHLDIMDGTLAGHNKLNRINGSDNHVTIQPLKPGDDGNHTSYDDPDDTFGTPGDPGDGSDATVYYNPDSTQCGDGSEPWQNRPPDVGLFHEMGHAADAVSGERPTGRQDVGDQNVRNDEAKTVGVGTYGGAYTDSENDYRRERGQPPRPRV